MLALCWEYLGGRAVATDPNDRLRAEWPPHPDRVFQALVSAWGGRGDDKREALKWMEEQGAPWLAVPLAVSEGAQIKTFVPVNDIEGPSRGVYTERHLGLLPTHRERAARTFPATVVGHETCALVWPDANPTANHRAALEATCAAVTHLGHSTSLVRMWLSDERPKMTYRPVERRPEHVLRAATPGRLDALVKAYADGGAGWVRPPQAAWQGYAACDIEGVAKGSFDRRMVVLKQAAGPRLGLLQTLAATRALRATLIKAADSVPGALSLLSGHATDGSPMTDDHVAYLPLAYVGDPASSRRHADGHLLGLALALPNVLDGDSEQEIFDVLAQAFATSGDRLRLTMGPFGVVDLEAEASPNAPLSLRSEVWSRPNLLWGTVTPIVLDRLPPRRHVDHDQWAADQIVQACSRQGLPAPQAIELSGVCPHLGGPSAAAFLPLKRKDGASRWHLHARLRFDVPVQGPLLLGAGRFQGYGLCKPLSTGGAS